ncbi:hypothetical protein [Stappia sp.]|uniref:hypothetical protein n=1 Tax=Stappia sp. TaxID=1870903 RepID=UPI003A99A64E
MTHPDLDDDRDKEPPLDPAAQRLQAKLKRLLAISSLVMGLGFVAVFAAILYKLNEGGARPDGAGIAATIVLDKDERVEGLAMQDGRMVLLVKRGEAARLVYLDPATGQVLGETTFVSR